MTQPTPPPWYSDHVTTIYLTPCKEDELTVRIISSGPAYSHECLLHPLRAILAERSRARSAVSDLPRVRRPPVQKAERTCSLR